MEHFESTKILMQLLKDDKYKRLVMKDDGSLNSQENYTTDISSK